MNLKLCSAYALCVAVFVLASMILLSKASESDTKEVCETDSKKGVEQMRSKYKDNIEKWKALHDRACTGIFLKLEF